MVRTSTSRKVPAGKVPCLVMSLSIVAGEVGLMVDFRRLVSK